MRSNVFVAQATGMSRRAADRVIAGGRVTVDHEQAVTGSQIEPGQIVKLDGKNIALPIKTTTILLHKPADYVSSRDGQGSRTIYDLLPPDLQHLKPVGRLDKYSSGLLLLTNDGQLAHKLTHPSFEKEKEYEVTLDRSLADADRQQITKTGVILEDGPSRFYLEPISDTSKRWVVRMHEGRNRQIRRTFEALNYRVKTLHRTRFGDYKLDQLRPGSFIHIA